MRQNCLSHSSMTYLNLSVSGMRGKYYPALANYLTSFDVQKCQHPLKLLCQDYLIYEKRANQSGCFQHC